jgi:hypothetical protein
LRPSATPPRSAWAHSSSATSPDLPSAFASGGDPPLIQPTVHPARRCHHEARFLCRGICFCYFLCISVSSVLPYMRLGFVAQVVPAVRRESAVVKKNDAGRPEASSFCVATPLLAVRYTWCCHHEELRTRRSCAWRSDEGSAFALAGVPPFGFKGGPLLILAFSCALINRLIAPSTEKASGIFPAAISAVLLDCK